MQQAWHLGSAITHPQQVDAIIREIIMAMLPTPLIFQKKFQITFSVTSLTFLKTN
jgi:hypothetical protein